MTNISDETQKRGGVGFVLLLIFILICIAEPLIGLCFRVYDIQ